jgi:hypothetical protein
MDGMILLLLHKLYTQNKRDLILQMYLFYYLVKTPNFEYSFPYILLFYNMNVESTLYTWTESTTVGQWVNAYTYNSNTYLGMRW